MIQKLKNDNVLFQILSDYDWLGRINHNISDYNAHLEALNKKFGQQLYRQIVANVKFSPSILEKYKDVYLKSIPTVSTSGGIVNRFIFQLSNDFIIDFMIGLDGNRPCILFEAQTTCLGNVVDFINENVDFIMGEEKKFGFNAH